MSFALAFVRWPEKRNRVGEPEAEPCKFAKQYTKAKREVLCAIAVVGCSVFIF